MEKEQQIILNIEGISSIKYEAPKDFQSSVSYTYYKQALKMTEEIVKNNYTIFEQESPAFIQSRGTELRNNRQLYNIIFFTGDRGTGKTSTMLSYMEFLKDYHRNIKKGEISDEDLRISLERQEIMFTGLEYIDASILDDKEDILGSVLSKMLKKWMEEEQRGIVKGHDYEYKKRKLQDLFSQVYEWRKKLLGVRDSSEEDSEMFMDNLQNMTMTFNMKRAFQELVSSYLEIMKYPGAEYLSDKCHFLIICIDDLDMNISKGFQLLEQIRKYLMIPKIIILLSANYEQLDKICNNHYFKEFEKTKSSDMSVYIENLSREYLEKIIPVQRQIAMPSGEKWTLMQKKNFCIKYQDVEGKIFKETGNLYSIVEKMLRERIGISWDISENSIHYLTPMTLRELCAWIIEISHLVNDKQEYNTEYYLDREFFRTCRKYLRNEEQKIFFDAEKVGIESRMQILYKILRKYTSAISTEEVLKPKIGDILELVSISQTREFDAVTIGSLVSIYCTLKINTFIWNIRSENEQKRKQALECLYKYYGRGVWGNWESHFIGDIVSSAEGQIKYIRQIARNKSNQMKNCLMLPIDKNYDLNDPKSIFEFILKNKEKIINYQYLLLFYHLENDINSDIWKYDENTSSLYMEEGTSGEFSLSGVVLNLLMKDSLAFQFMPKFIKIFNLESAITELPNLSDLIRNMSLSQQIENWNSENDPLIPIHNMDYLLTTARLLQENLGKEMIMSRNNIGAVLQNYFMLIAQNLKEYDNRAKTKYVNHFNKCPLVRKIKNKDFLEQLRISVLSFIPSEDKDNSWTGGMING